MAWKILKLNSNFLWMGLTTVVDVSLDVSCSLLKRIWCVCISDIKDKSGLFNKSVIDKKKCQPCTFLLGDQLAGCFVLFTFKTDHQSLCLTFLWCLCLGVHCMENATEQTQTQFNSFLLEPVTLRHSKLWNCFKFNLIHFYFGLFDFLVRSLLHMVFYPVKWKSSLSFSEMHAWPSKWSAPWST